MLGNIKGLSSHEVVIALSSMSKEAFFHMYYADVDNRNHKSLDSLVHILEDSGFDKFASIIKNQQPYIVFENPEEALKTYHFVNEHSAAINVNLVYKGCQNEEAAAKIKKDFPKAKENNLLHTVKKIT